ncbi:MAG: zf-HC2 domain-containing protein [Candidatus Zixiibacteriota bacterium]
MKCRKAQKLIPSYAELDLPRKARLDEHLEACPDCSRDFTLHQESINLAKEVTCFEESGDFWDDYRVDLTRRIPSLPLWRRVWTKLEELTGSAGVPFLGPIPAYVLSFVIMALIAVSLYEGMLSPKSAQAFSNNLVAYEGDLLSAVDDGGQTIYTLGRR